MVRAKKIEKSLHSFSRSVHVKCSVNLCFNDDNRASHIASLLFPFCVLETIYND